MTLIGYRHWPADDETREHYSPVTEYKDMIDETKELIFAESIEELQEIVEARIGKPGLTRTSITGYRKNDQELIVYTNYSMPPNISYENFCETVKRYRRVPFRGGPFNFRHKSWDQNNHNENDCYGKSFKEILCLKTGIVVEKNEADNNEYVFDTKEANKQLEEIIEIYKISEKKRKQKDAYDLRNKAIGKYTLRDLAIGLEHSIITELRPKFEAVFNRVKPEFALKYPTIVKGYYYNEPQTRYRDAYGINKPDLPYAILNLIDTHQAVFGKNSHRQLKAFQTFKEMWKQKVPSAKKASTNNKKFIEFMDAEAKIRKPPERLIDVFKAKKITI